MNSPDSSQFCSHNCFRSDFSVDTNDHTCSLNDPLNMFGYVACAGLSGAQLSSRKNQQLEEVFSRVRNPFVGQGYQGGHEEILGDFHGGLNRMKIHRLVRW